MNAAISTATTTPSTRSDERRNSFLQTNIRSIRSGRPLAGR